MQISVITMQSGSYAVWMVIYAPLTQRRAAVEDEPDVVVDKRTLLVKFQPMP